MHTFLGEGQQSFESMWYWLIVVAEWSALGNRIYGIPAATILRARKLPEAQEDVDALYMLFQRRYRRSMPRYIEIPFAFIAFGLSVLATTAWMGHYVLAQAIFILVAPPILIGFWNYLQLQRPLIADLRGQNLRRHLLRQRYGIQALGLIWISCALLWGLHVNVGLMNILSP